MSRSVQFIRFRRRQRDSDFEEVGMSRIFVAGLGAVSPAGWNVAALREALDKGEPMPTQAGGPARLGETAPQPDWCRTPPCAPNFWRTRDCGARVRSRITPPPPRSKPWPGLRANPAAKAGWASSSACNLVAWNYSCRFFDETLKDPARPAR
jgi:hypothetical protein